VIFFFIYLFIYAYNVWVISSPFPPSPSLSIRDSKFSKTLSTIHFREKGNCCGSLNLKIRNRNNPVAYLPKKLDGTALGWSGCLTVSYYFCVSGGSNEDNAGQTIRSFNSPPD
jgi:hypothetical protein